MIGLKKGKVKLSEYCDEWKDLFNLEKNILTKCLSHLKVDIEHIGSTSIPGIPAKPIIDIVIGVSNRKELLDSVKTLSESGYVDKGDQGNEGGYLLVKDSAPLIRTHHIHIVEKSDDQWKNYLKFRDILSENQDLRNEYTNLKRNLESKYTDNRDIYTSSKHEFIQKILKH